MSEKILKASAAKVNITPPADWMPMYNKRNGSGGAPSYFGSILDDIYAKALMIDNGCERIMILVYDGLALPVNVVKIREIAAEAAGTSVKNVLVTNTHDHNAVPCNESDLKIEDEYDSHRKILENLTVLENAARQLGEECAKTLQPARIGYASGDSYVNVNRHLDLPGGQHSIYGFERHRFSDRELIVLRIDDLQGQPICILFNYGCHASLLANNKPDGKFTQLSGDLAGNTCRRVEAKWENAPVVIHTCGAGGDQNAVLIARVYDVAEDAGVVMHDFGPAGPICLNFMADMLAADVDRIARSVTDYMDYAPLWAAKRYVVCDKMAREPRMQELRGDVNFEFEVFMIGDIAIATTNGETYSAIGRRVKDGSPFRKTIYMNVPDTAVGYIMDDSGYGVGEKCIKENIFEMMSEYAQGYEGTIKDLGKKA